MQVKLAVPASLAAAALAAAALMTPCPAWAQTPSGTPAQMVATYDTLADAILATKRTEDNLVKSILAATLGHGHGVLGQAQKAIAGGDAKAAAAAVEALAADVGQLATEGDNAVGAVRKRLLEGGHHHNAAGEAQGLFDAGYVVVTKAAKVQLLDSSRAIGAMAAAPDAKALAAEWSKVAGVVDGLLKPAK